MADLNFDSWEQLQKWMGSDEVEGVTGVSGRIAGRRPATNARTKLAELLSEIRGICNTAPWNLRGIIDNHDIMVEEYGNGRIVASAPFREQAWRPSKWDWYDSFIPVLMDRGWLWKGETPNKKGRSFPTYQYFIGTHEIEAAINRFNRKYKKQGYRAVFDVGDDSRIWPTGR